MAHKKTASRPAVWADDPSRLHRAPHSSPNVTLAIPTPKGHVLVNGRSMGKSTRSTDCPFDADWSLFDVKATHTGPPVAAVAPGRNTLPCACSEATHLAPSTSWSLFKGGSVSITGDLHMASASLPAPDIARIIWIGRPQRLDYVAATNTDTGYVMRPRDYQPHRCAPPPCIQTANFPAFSGLARSPLFPGGLRAPRCYCDPLWSPFRRVDSAAPLKYLEDAETERNTAQWPSTYSSDAEASVEYPVLYLTQMSLYTAQLIFSYDADTSSSAPGCKTGLRRAERAVFRTCIDIKDRDMLGESMYR
ncbi:hypothetical protein EVG20_g6677 [Dentipellis fragilis]|uniref:Uncharacterized protein n=1 Tax=Dentipellis fragilis TaxID=205917 RepID=A0A4Y9YIZ2_9AGAM|nr:hypothetical protein EVG20_g6677 [Dentipellis fragilis]